MAGERVFQAEADKKEVVAFRTLQSLDELASGLGYGFSPARFGNMSPLHGSREEVLENRKRFAEAAGFDSEKMVEMTPEAGDKILVVGKKDIGISLSRADALITTDKEVVLALMPADCTPIIITNKKGDFTAIIHAGREGTKLELAKKTVEKLKEMGFTDPTDFVVGIGPAVECYSAPSFATDDPDRWLNHVYVSHVEGEEVEFQVKENDTRFPGKYKIETSPHRELFVDMTGCNVAQLIETGIPKENIEVSGVCTVCNATLGRMFSYGVHEKKGLKQARFLAYTVLK